MLNINGEKYDLVMNTGAILELTALLGLFLIFGSLVWFAKRKEGISLSVVILLSVLFLASAGTMLFCRMSFVGTMSSPADDK